MSIKTDPEAPAFGDTATYGLTKREWFAGMALQGLLAYEGPAAVTHDEHSYSVAGDAIAAADFLIARLSKDEDG